MFECQGESGTRHHIAWLWLLIRRVGSSAKGSRKGDSSSEPECSRRRGGHSCVGGPMSPDSDPWRHGTAYFGSMETWKNQGALHDSQIACGRCGDRDARSASSPSAAERPVRRIRTPRHRHHQLYEVDGNGEVLARSSPITGYTSGATTTTVTCHLSGCTAKGSFTTKVTSGTVTGTIKGAAGTKASPSGKCAALTGSNTDSRHAHHEVDGDPSGCPIGAGRQERRRWHQVQPRDLHHPGQDRGHQPADRSSVPIAGTRTRRSPRPPTRSLRSWPPCKSGLSSLAIETEPGAVPVSSGLGAHHRPAIGHAVPTRTGLRPRPRRVSAGSLRRRGEKQWLPPSSRRFRVQLGRWRSVCGLQGESGLRTTSPGCGP